MLKKAFLLLTLVAGVSAHAEKLNIQCEAPGAKKLTISLDTRSGADPAIVLNGTPRDKLYIKSYDLRPSKQGNGYRLFTSHFVSSQNVLKLFAKVKDCRELQASSGYAIANEYAGGYRSRRLTHFNCTCNLN